MALKKFAFKETDSTDSEYQENKSTDNYNILNSAEDREQSIDDNPEILIPVDDP